MFDSLLSHHIPFLNHFSQILSCYFNDFLPAKPQKRLISAVFIFLMHILNIGTDYAYI